MVEKEEDNNSSSNSIGYVNSRDYDKVVRKLREFFIIKGLLKFIHKVDLVF